MRLVEFTIKVPVPLPVERIVVFFVLLYRRVRYGYTFRRIKLTRGQYALVDVEDFDQLNQYKWYCTHRGYVKRAVPNKSGKGGQRLVMMHRELCPVPRGMFVDHINRNPLDNRKANLRPATHRQNVWNRKLTRRSGKTCYTGIHWDKRRQKWQVLVRIDGRSRGFGCYADEIEAAKAYDKAAKQYRGEFAVLNFPEK